MTPDWGLLRDQKNKVSANAAGPLAIAPTVALAVILAAGSVDIAVSNLPINCRRLPCPAIVGIELPGAPPAAAFAAAAIGDPTADTFDTRADKSPRAPRRLTTSPEVSRVNALVPRALHNA